MGFGGWLYAAPIERGLEEEAGQVEEAGAGVEQRGSKAGAGRRWRTTVVGPGKGGEA